MASTHQLCDASISVVEKELSSGAPSGEERVRTVVSGHVEVLRAFTSSEREGYHALSRLLFYS